jgi:uncharacterized protein YdaU (DUF1376 family)
MADFPSLPLFTDAFIADTGHLNATETGAYIALLMAAWRTPDCSLPNDDVRLARMARCDARTWRKIKAVVLAFWTIDGTQLRQKRLTREREFCHTSRKNKQKGADAANEAIALAKQLKSLEPLHAERNADDHAESHASVTQPIPTPSKEEDGIRSAREDRQFLEIVLRKAAGWESQPSPNLCVTGSMQALIDNGADLELDVLPVVRALAPRVRSPTSWNYFLKPIAQARDDRLAAASMKANPKPTGNHHDKPKSNADNAATVVNSIRDQIAEIEAAGSFSDESSEASSDLPRLRQSAA